MGDIKTISEIIESATGQKPISEHQITYDSPGDQLEPLYFFILDLMNDFNLEPEKLLDNFAYSEGSGHQTEIGQKKSIMQQQVDHNMKTIYTLIRSLTQLVYDLKEFRIRLNAYKDLKSEDKSIQRSARLSLKQVWMDKVDMQKGNSAIKAMALSQAGFQTLIQAFLVSDTIKDAEKLDLNEIVKRILVPRIKEFEYWLEHSEKELTKRYNIEKNYLKSQVNSLKLYSRWVKPYLISAQKLESTQSKNAALVSTFNTVIQELTLLGKSEIDPKESIMKGDLPKELSKLKSNNFKRKYYSCTLVDFMFRGIPRKVSQRGDYAFGGRTEIVFKSYALNEDELKKFNQEMEKSDVNEVLQLIEGATTDSLKELQEEIDFFIEDKETEEEKKKEKKQGNNPFLALIGHYEKNPEKKDTKKEDKIDKIRKDNWLEKEHLRKLAEEKAKETTFKLFNVYKKVHGMANFDPD